MKNILVILMLLAIFILPGCNSNTTEKQADENASDISAAPANATTDSTTQLAYICPMQCEGSASNEPGKCPVCGMDLVKNPNHHASAPDSAAHTD